MAINEVFPNPLVKQVIFQIRYPNLFFIENKIGDIQIKIMKVFPESSLLYRQRLLLTDIKSDSKIEDFKFDPAQEANKKVWQFKSKDGVELHINSDSLDMKSVSHKTYNNQSEERRFRDIIQFVVDTFLENIKIPSFIRMGLRYIDEGPLVEKNNETFNNNYNSVFNLSKFDLSRIQNYSFRTTIEKDSNLFLNYGESLSKVDNKNVLILDFDGYTYNINVNEYLSTLDRLHNVISDEFESTIREPILQYMRTKN